MTDLDLAIEKDLMKCWYKKTARTYAKIVLYLAYAIDIFAAGAIALYGVINLCALLVNPITATRDTMYSGLQYLFSIACSIPWYVYVGIVAIAAIPVYSYAWCITRRLTEEDWDSEESHITATVISRISGCILFIFGIITVLCIGAISSNTPPQIVTLSFISCFAAACGVAFLIGMPKDVGFENMKAWLLVGAYLHYRKRIGGLK
jgi:hypothetical protein